jgi:hypothetical protein
MRLHARFCRAPQRAPSRGALAGLGTRRSLPSFVGAACLTPLTDQDCIAIPNACTRLEPPGATLNRPGRPLPTTSEPRHPQTHARTSSRRVQQGRLAGTPQPPGNPCAGGSGKSRAPDCPENLTSTLLFSPPAAQHPRPRMRAATSCKADGPRAAAPHLAAAPAPRRCPCFPALPRLLAAGPACGAAKPTPACLPPAPAPRMRAPAAAATSWAPGPCIPHIHSADE